MSEGLNVEDPQTGKKFQCKIVIMTKCPVNLLGRDMLHALDISVVPVEGGLRAHRLCEKQITAVDNEP